MILSWFSFISLGRSGIQVGILGSTDPIWEAFGDMYGNFLYTDVDGGTMEVTEHYSTPVLII